MRHEYDPARGLYVPRDRLAEPRRLRTCSGLAHHGLLMADGASAPTDPNFANVSLLLHFNNAAGNPIDSSVNGYVAASNSCVIGTTQVKFGAASAEFNGTTTYATYTHTAPLDLTTGDFTLECWVYFSTVTASKVILAKATGTGFYPFQITCNASSHLTFAGFDTSNALAYSITGSATLVVNTWYHVACTRNGNTFTIWLDGVSDGTASSSAALRTNSGDVVCIGNIGGVAVLSGYLDDVRITKGVARYTAGFTRPSAQFPDS